MPVLTVTKSYSDGNTLTESMLDDIKSSIETFINTTKLDDSNLQTSGVSSDNLAAASVTATKIAADAVTTTKILDANVTAAKLAAASVTSAKLDTNIAVAGTLSTGGALAVTGAITATTDITATGNLAATGTLKQNSKNAVVSNTNASAALCIIRGTIRFTQASATASIINGEGFNITGSGAGIPQYVSVGFTTPFADAPAVVATIDYKTSTYAAYIVTRSNTTSGTNLVISGNGATADIDIHFMAIGVRA